MGGIRESRLGLATLGAPAGQGTDRRDHHSSRLPRRSAGKGHECRPGNEPDGPVHPCPTGGGGFEYFYGCIAGRHQWYPAIYEGPHRGAGKSPEEGYHFTET